VRAQHPNGQGTEIAYTNGRRSNENMYAVSWHPVYTQDLASIIANLETSFETSGQNLSVWLATTPRSLAHLRKFPQAVQHKWYLSRIKEFESIIAKGAAEIIDRSQIPLNALLIPTAWVFRIKLDGTLKSRLVLLGHLMPKDEDFDISAPTPRLSSVRFILAIAIKMDLAASLDDVDTAFTYAVPHTTLYGMLPDGLYEDRRLHGKCIHLLRNLYGSAEAPRLFHDLSHNWFIGSARTMSLHQMDQKCPAILPCPH
jgi:hypothetical protein